MKPERMADLQLRGSAGPLRTRVFWPECPESPALLVFFHAGEDGLCREFCARAGVVLLSACPVDPDDAATVVEWAADHALELGVAPGRLLIGGEGPGGALAAAVALRARDNRWPALMGQVLIAPGALRELLGGTTTTERNPRESD